MIKKLLKKKKEDGQAILEFVMVLPIFLLCLFLILDYGWMFYNYIAIENSARNAARVACVEYTDVCVMRDANNNLVSSGITTYYLDDLSRYETYSQEEKDILKEIKNSVTSTTKIESITIEYTADSDLAPGHVFNTKNRSNGDVKVVVKFKLKMLIGITGGGMNKTLTTQSTYKVEKIASD